MLDCMATHPTLGTRCVREHGHIETHRVWSAPGVPLKVFDWGNYCENYDKKRGSIMAKPKLVVDKKKARAKYRTTEQRAEAFSAADPLTSKLPGVWGGIAWAALEQGARIAVALARIADAQELLALQGEINITGARIICPPNVIAALKPRMFDLLERIATGPR